jgi:hypothetical protein
VRVWPRSWIRFTATPLWLLVSLLWAMTSRVTWPRGLMNVDTPGYLEVFFVTCLLSALLWACAELGTPVWTLLPVSAAARTGGSPVLRSPLPQAVMVTLAALRFKVGVLLGQLVARRASEVMLWDFVQAELDFALRGAAGQLVGAALQPYLYQCRHGGAAHEKLWGARQLLEAQQWGGWGRLHALPGNMLLGRIGIRMQMGPISKLRRLRALGRGSAGRCAVIFAMPFAQLRPGRGASSWTSSPAAATSLGPSGRGGRPSLPSTSCWARSLT